MKVYALPSIDIEQAIQLQFKLVDTITQHLGGDVLLSLGDLGVKTQFNQPLLTHQIEAILADFFGAEAALLVRGAGTNAIRLALYAAMNEARRVLVHDAPIYPTTQVTFDMLGVQLFHANFNDQNEVKCILLKEKVDVVYIQTTRQQMDDNYDLTELIDLCRSIQPEITIIVDDNYAILKTPGNGIVSGADLSCFSCFKLLGPEGIGCIIGKKQYIEQLRKSNYSGGGQVQGWEAHEVLRGMVYAPVALAISGKVGQEVVNRLNNGEVKGIKSAMQVNAQSKVIVVELNLPNAPAVIKRSIERGALPYPVGAESKYEIAPLFYRVSKTFRDSIPNADQYLIRINPNRAGADTIIRILQEAIEWQENE